ncbi:MAG: Protein ArsC [Methanoregulaceae archaeon PtaU1.Bin059]|nr:MAG: Protein ArsC [Methanoregulaceae archaeon PtaB.Bin152]OPY42289.1 MAG: Protein ArsC [Methanoregulaceae archaeon PtaU1.Bin059]
MKKRVLFICTHNSARSQMAEGYLRSRYGDRYEAFSAGTDATTLHPLAIAVMKEIGIDISGQHAKTLSDLAGVEMDIVVTVCDSARASCPFFPWTKETLHIAFMDPGDVVGSEERMIEVFRSVRDQITGWIDGYFGKGSVHD